MPGQVNQNGDSSFGFFANFAASFLKQFKFLLKLFLGGCIDSSDIVVEILTDRRICQHLFQIDTVLLNRDWQRIDVFVLCQSCDESTKTLWVVGWYTFGQRFHVGRGGGRWSSADRGKRGHFWIGGVVALVVVVLWFWYSMLSVPECIPSKVATMDGWCRLCRARPCCVRRRGQRLRSGQGGTSAHRLRFARPITIGIQIVHKIEWQPFTHQIIPSETSSSCLHQPAIVHAMVSTTETKKTNHAARRCTRITSAWK